MFFDRTRCRGLTPRCFTFALWLAAAASATGQSAGNPPNRSEQWDEFHIDREPTAPDWQHFHRRSPAQRQQLWEHHAGRGKKLGHWHWAWRIGWARSCAVDSASYCLDVLKAAMQDRALFVRAEAAVRWGQRFRGTSNPQAITILADAYANPRNLRNGKPLIVQERVLFALQEIGGEQARQRATALAASSPTTKDYWQRIRNF